MGDTRELRVVGIEVIQIEDGARIDLVGLNKLIPIQVGPGNVQLRVVCGVDGGDVFGPAARVVAGVTGTEEGLRIARKIVGESRCEGTGSSRCSRARFREKSTAGMMSGIAMLAGIWDGLFGAGLVVEAKPQLETPSIAREDVLEVQRRVGDLVRNIGGTEEPCLPRLTQSEHGDGVTAVLGKSVGRESPELETELHLVIAAAAARQEVVPVEVRNQAGSLGIVPVRFISR